MTFERKDIENILTEKYSNDSILLIATSNNQVPSVRSVDSFYYQGSFWIVTSLNCNYVKEIRNNENVMISDGGHNRLWCKAVIAGHPLEEKNKSIREIFLKVFHYWYQEVNNENLDSVCYLQVTPYKGYLHKDKIGYTFDFNQNIFSSGDITHHIDVKLEPFW